VANEGIVSSIDVTTLVDDIEQQTQVLRTLSLSALSRKFFSIETCGRITESNQHEFATSGMWGSHPVSGIRIVTNRVDILEKVQVSPQSSAERLCWLGKPRQTFREYSCG